MDNEDESLLDVLTDAAGAVSDTVGEFADELRRLGGEVVGHIDGHLARGRGWSCGSRGADRVTTG